MTVRSLAWALTFGLLVVFAVPWFLWGADGVVYGLPLWLWWHVGWMVLTAAVFYWFARTDWGIWIDDGPTDDVAGDR